MTALMPEPAPPPSPVATASDAPTTEAPPTEAAPGRKRRRVKSRLLRWLHPDGVRWGTEPDDFDPKAVQGAHRALGTLFGRRRYFRVEASGWEHLPSAPTMVVSNHSGGTLFLDSWGLLWAWYDHFGANDRPIHPAVHELLVGNRVTGGFLASCGAVRADRRLGERVLERGHDLLVMPGGDLDVWRPYQQRYTVRFAGRTGYAKMALEAGVPVVPVGHAGPHETFIVLSDGRRLAEALQLPTLVRAHIWPVHLSLPWGLAVGPLPHLPPPTKLRYRFGRAVHPEDVGARPGQPVSEDMVTAFDALVRAGVQAQLDALKRER